MQTMLRLVGFGDNAGSGFPTILDVWKSEGWIKPELIEDTNLDQVTLMMKMEKESDDESAEKSADSAECIFRKNCASVPEERSAIPLQTEQSSAG